jgi:hypothetical protein
VQRDAAFRRPKAALQRASRLAQRISPSVGRIALLLPLKVAIVELDVCIIDGAIAGGRTIVMPAERDAAAFAAVDGSDGAVLPFRFLS